MDILEACGASDRGSNPRSGTCCEVTNMRKRPARYRKAMGLAILTFMTVTLFLSAIPAEAETTEMKLVWGTDEYKEETISVDIGIADSSATLNVEVEVKDTKYIQWGYVDFFLLTEKEFTAYKQTVDQGLAQFNVNDVDEERFSLTSSDWDTEVEITEAVKYHLIVDISGDTGEAMDDLPAEARGHTTLVEAKHTTGKSANLLLFGAIITIVIIVVVLFFSVQIYKKHKQQEETDKDKLSKLKNLRSEEAEVERKMRAAMMRSDYEGQSPGGQPGVIDPKTQALLDEQKRKRQEEDMELRQREMELQQQGYPQQQQGYPQQQQGYPQQQQGYPQQQQGYPQQQQQGYPQQQRRKQQ